MYECKTKLLNISPLWICVWPRSHKTIQVELVNGCVVFLQGQKIKNIINYFDIVELMSFFFYFYCINHKLLSTYSFKIPRSKVSWLVPCSDWGVEVGNLFEIQSYMQICAKRKYTSSNWSLKFVSWPELKHKFWVAELVFIRQITFHSKWFEILTVKLIFILYKVLEERRIWKW